MEKRIVMERYSDGDVRYRCEKLINGQWELMYVSEVNLKSGDYSIKPCITLSYAEARNYMNFALETVERRVVWKNGEEVDEKI